MNLLKKLSISLFLLSVSSFSYVGAQESSVSNVPLQKNVQQPQATLIADVNFDNIKATSSKGVLLVSFSIKSSFGNVNNVTYGVSISSKKTGKFIDDFLATEKLNLLEGEKIERSFSYILPVDVAESAIVYLVAYNERGLPLATSNISELQKGVTSIVCTQDSESVTCIPSKDVSLEVLVRDISLPNTVFKTNGVIPLKKGIPHTQKLSDIVTSYRPSSYVITFQVKDQSNVPSGKYSFGYIKEGDMSRILSLVPQVLIENENITLKAVIYTNTVSDTKKPYDFKITLNDTCGSMVTPVTSNVSVVTITTKCASGNMEVSLISNGKVLDTLQAMYSLPADKIVNTSGNKNSSSVALGNNKTTIQVIVLVVVTIIVLGLVLIIFYKKKKLPVVPVSIIFIFFFLTFFSQAHAALYVVGGTVTYEYCQKGNPVVPTWSCTDVMGEPWPVLSQSGYTTSGTVTVPSSVTPGSSYTVTITQSLTSTLNTQCGWSYLPCTSADIQTIVIKDLQGTAYNSLPCGYAGSLCSTPFDIYFDRALGPSSFTLTASSSGTIKLGILQSASGNGVTHCTNKCFTYPYTHNLITIPITAPCTWGWGVGTYLNPGGNKSDPGCDVGIVDPATVCNASNSGEALICYDVPPDAFRYLCACRPILPTTACLLECEGSRTFKTCPTCAVNDFTCPAGYRLKQNVCGVSVGGAPYGCVKDTSCLAATPVPTVNLWFSP